MARRKPRPQSTRRRPEHRQVDPTEEQLQTIALRVKKGNLTQPDYEELARRLGFDEARLRALINEIRLRNTLEAEFEKSRMVELEKLRAQISLQEETRLKVETEVNQSLSSYLESLKAFSQITNFVPSLIGDFDEASYKHNNVLAQFLLSVYENCRQYRIKKGVSAKLGGEYSAKPEELESMVETLRAQTLEVGSKVEPLVQHNPLERVVEKLDKKVTDEVLDRYQQVLNVLTAVDEILNENITEMMDRNLEITAPAKLPERLKVLHAARTELKRVRESYLSYVERFRNVNQAGSRTEAPTGYHG